MSRVLSIPASFSGAGLRSAAQLPSEASTRWDWAALMGRLVELSSPGNGAPLTFAFELVLDAQRHAEPTAWITTRGTTFYPPDVAAFGVDLDALAVVRVPSHEEVPRAADKILRSGAFGLVVLELRPQPIRIPPPLLSRLGSLAQKHSAVVLGLTEKTKGEPSLGSLVSLRAEALRTQVAPGQFRCELHILKDKRAGPGWQHVEICRGPEGMRRRCEPDVPR